jgi:hypothetical protein
MPKSVRPSPAKSALAMFSPAIISPAMLSLAMFSLAKVKSLPKVCRTSIAAATAREAERVAACAKRPLIDG